MDRELETIVGEVRTNIAHSSIPSEGDDRRYAEALLRHNKYLKNPVMYALKDPLLAVGASMATVIAIKVLNPTISSATELYVSLATALSPMVAVGLSAVTRQIRDSETLREYNDALEDSRNNL